MNAAAPVLGISNIEAEACLLGGLMQDNGQVDRVADIVRPEHFFEPLHGRIYSAIVREHSLGRAANPVTLKPYFDADPTIHEVGGVGYLGKLTGGALPLGLCGLAEQVHELAARRRLVGAMGEWLAQANDYDCPLEQVVAGIETDLADAVGEDPSSTAVGAGDAIARLVEELDEPDEGVTSGGLIPSFDALVGKLRPADLCVVAGRPGMGKTTLAQSYALGAARAGHGVLFVSLEMHRRQLAAKFACDWLSDRPERVPYAAVVKRGLTQDQRRSLARAALEIRELPLVIEDLSGVTIGRLHRVVRRHARRFAAKGVRLDMVVVDYLQLVDADDRGLDIRSSVTKVSRGLKCIAKAGGLAVMALAQLNRKVEERADKRPRTADLRESGQVEQDADQIVFLLRREKYLREEEPDQAGADWPEWRAELDRHAGRIEFIVAKNRHGIEGSASGEWRGAYQAVR